MNYMVSLTPTHPTPFNNAGQPGIPAKEWLNVQLAAGGGTIPASGTWYKINQITTPAPLLPRGRGGTATGSLEVADLSGARQITGRRRPKGSCHAGEYVDVHHRDRRPNHL